MPALRERLADLRVTIIEGRRVLVVERRPPLPPTLNLLLEGGRDTRGRLWYPLRTIARVPLHLSGTRNACLSEQDHRLNDWLDGFYTGPAMLAEEGEEPLETLVVRPLHLLACSDCGSVQVRDVSMDPLPRLAHGRLPLRRRNLVLGWYSGARRRQRVYN